MEVQVVAGRTDLFLNLNMLSNEIQAFTDRSYSDLLTVQL